MCGICGSLSLDLEQPADPRAVGDMCRALAHRGPDDEGIWARGPVALGQRRLSIIDVAGGHQPLSNEDGTVWITYNGEVYNFQELRRELVGKGHTFATRSDTEVLVHLYEEDGPDFLCRLNGMFALALWDGRARRLVMARDRMGQKPLYWGTFDGVLLFASELKGILAHPAARRRIDLDSLSRYLALEAVPAPHSILCDVHKLRPAGRAVVEGGRVREDTYWEYPLGRDPLDISLREAQEGLLERLRTAVKRRLISEVPLGVFLSGGIDSSTVTALMCEGGAGSVKSFAIGFEETAEDESAHARTVAQHLGTEHREEMLSSAAALDLVPSLSDILDEPFADPSILPTYLLSRFTRRHVTVALGGDGGDELIAGYPEYLAPQYPAVYKKLPRAVRQRVLQPVLRRVPPAMGLMHRVARLERRLLGLAADGEVRHHAWRGGFTEEEQPRLFTPEAWEQVTAGCAYDQVRHYASCCESSDPIDRLLFVDAKILMQDIILAKVDRASMAVGLEVRAPLLDHEVVEFLAGLPLRYKLHGQVGKYVLKRAVADLLPAGIIHRRKHGFAVPLREWFRGEFRPLAEEMFAADRLADAGLFRHGYVRGLLDDHYAERADNHRSLWVLLMFELWYERYIRHGARR